MFCWFPTFKLYASFPSTSRTKVEFWGFHSPWSYWTFSDYGEISCAGWYQLGSIYDMTINDNLWNKVTKRCNHIDRTRDQVPVRPLELSAADHIAVALSCWSLSAHFWSSSGEDSWEFVLGAKRILLETFWILVHMYISSQKETHAGEQSWVTSPNATPCSGDDDVYARTIRFIRTLGSYCCAQFAVSKERIRANPLERLGLAIPSWFAVESERFSAETHHLFILGSHRSLLEGCSKTHTLSSLKSEMHIDYGHLLRVSEEYAWSHPSGRYQRMQEMLFSDSPKECHDIPGHPTLCLMFEAVGRCFFFSAD